MDTIQQKTETPGEMTEIKGETEDSQSSIDTQAASQSASHTNTNTEIAQSHVGPRKEVFEFSVRLKHRRPLKIGEPTELDTFVRADVPNTDFDKKDRVFRPTRSGSYGLNVSVWEGGEGEMDVLLYINDEYGHHIGTTGGQHDHVSTFRILPLGFTVGNAYGLKVVARKGRPRVFGCEFSGFLL